MKYKICMEKKVRKEMKLRKILTTVLLAGLAVGLSGCQSGTETLKLYNWGEYIGDDIISSFEKEYDVRVINEYFDSNEMMYTKLQGGDAYDIIIPSDYMIERLIKEGMLQPLDKSQLSNLGNLHDSVVGLQYDAGNTYSVPYFWGSVGIVYNQNNVNVDELESQGFSIFKNTAYSGKIYMYDSERDAFMMALKSLGYSMNTSNDDEITEAQQWLQEINDTMAPIYVTDEVIDAMVQGNKDLALVYSGDAAYIISENEDMNYFMPNEGTNLWSDGMCIPKNAENPELAHKFIDFILTYDGSYNNSETVGYTSSNGEVVADMIAEGGEYEGNMAYMPRTDYKLDEVFVDDEVLRRKLSELWIKVKAG